MHSSRHTASTRAAVELNTGDVPLIIWSTREELVPSRAPRTSDDHPSTARDCSLRAVPRPSTISTSPARSRIFRPFSYTVFADLHFAHLHPDT